MTVFQNVLARLNNVSYVANYRYPLVNRISTSVLQYKQSVEEKLGIKPRPKRPFSPFLRFILTHRTTVVQHNPNASPKEIVKLLSEEWKTVDEPTKTKLQEDYKNDWRHYLEDCKEYDKSLSPAEKEEIAKAKEEAKSSKAKKNLKKKKEDLGCPKKPGSSYVYFMKEKLPERGNLSLTEFQKKLKEDWEKLPELHKGRFEQLYQKDMEEYREKKALWMKKMEEEGQVISLKKEKPAGPKRPTSAYMYYLRSRLLHRGETPYRDYQKQVREEWEKLPAKEKKTFEDLHKKDLEEYYAKKAESSKQNSKAGVRSQ